MAETDLYRAVTTAELDDIVATGEYRLGSGALEGKHFFESASNAARFAQRMFRLFPEEGPYTFTTTTVSALVLKPCVKLNIAGEGIVWFVPANLLPLKPVEIWTYCPWGEEL